MEFFRLSSLLGLKGQLEEGTSVEELSASGHEKAAKSRRLSRLRREKRCGAPHRQVHTVTEGSEFASPSRHSNHFQCKYLRQNSARDIISGSSGKRLRFPVISIAWQYIATS